MRELVERQDRRTGVGERELDVVVRVDGEGDVQGREVLGGDSGC